MGTAFLGQYILLHKTSIAIKLDTAKKDKTTEGCMKFVQMAYTLAVHFFFMVRKMFDATIPSTGEKKKRRHDNGLQDVTGVACRLAVWERDDNGLRDVTGVACRLAVWERDDNGLKDV